MFAKVRVAVSLPLATIACVVPAWSASGETTSAQGVRHGLTVTLAPGEHRVEVIDEITLPPSAGQMVGSRVPFTLHAGLAPRASGEGWSVETAREDERLGGEWPVPVEHWVLVRTDAADASPVVAYGGPIHHPIEVEERDYQRSFSETPGIIDGRGAFLAGSTAWIPDFGRSIGGFTLAVGGLPEGWDVVSQGRREVTKNDGGTRRVTWRFPHRAEEIYLVAGPWTEYHEQAGDTDVYAFLREPDPALAGRYLEATARYLEMYESMLPPYPYGSFALVENFWETGYGMPGFTLLGPRVIRFPWILTSSYPHELLHNWWGNSVYVDDATGNWCEGITAYMADHLLAEQRGEGALYRRNTLKKFTDFVGSGTDFPLAEFRSRHSPASEAVGYGKALMLFHMARRALGDEAFLEGMRRFAREHSFRKARFEDIARHLEQADPQERDWTAFFQTWVSRPGAPRLKITAVSATVRPADAGDGTGQKAERTLLVQLAQVQEEKPFPLRVPVAVTLGGDTEPRWHVVEFSGRKTELRIEIPAAPVRVDVDPAFDVMRRLSPWEVPPALSTLFGSENPTFVLPSSAGGEELAAWKELAAAWSRPGEPRVVSDEAIEALPEGEVWILGWSNRFAGQAAESLEEHGLEWDGQELRVAGQTLSPGEHSAVLVARRDGAPDRAAGWVTAGMPAAIAGLARKLPHYSKYSYLGFRGGEPENILKGQWEPLHSPLSITLAPAGDAAPLQLAPREPLAEVPVPYDQARVRNAVETLASGEMDGRGLGSDGLARATQWVETRFREVGLEPAGEEGYRTSWTWSGGQPPREMTLTNLVGRIPGRDPALKNAPVLVMAHLDHLGHGWPDVRSGNEGRVHPGADDNASGVAVLLELARVLAQRPAPARPVLFAAVTGEEAGRLGSQHLLARLAGQGDVFACLNVDSVGRLADDGKLLVLNADSAREWRFVFMGVEHTTGVPISIVPEPLDSSDQVSCIEHGVPAIQFFTGPHEDYHRPSDVAASIEYGGMLRVLEAIDETVTYLADRTDPLTVTIAGTSPPAGAAGHPGGHPGHGTGGTRRAALGTVPDFAWGGEGVRVEQVLAGSAAEQAGVRAGDVLLAIDGEPTQDLRGYSQLLKAHSPGDTVVLTIRRGDRELDVTAELSER